MFWLIAIGLALLTLISLSWPWWVKSSSRQEKVSSSSQNKLLWKQQVAQLDQQLSEDDISEQEYQALKQELDRRLLQDVESLDENEEMKQSSPIFVVALVTIALLLGFMAYERWGGWQAYRLSERYQALMSAEDLEPQQVLPVLTEMQAFGLAAEEKGIDWLVLAARGFMQVQHYRKASETFESLLAIDAQSPVLLAEAAQAAYMSNGRQYSGKPQQYVDMALAINPNQANALGFAGMAAFEEGNYALSVDYWQTLIAILPPSEATDSVLAEALAEAKKRAGLAVGEPDIATADTAVKVTVSVDDTLSVDPNDTVFITARAVAGPPVPLAVKRLRVKDLPTDVVLTANDAMSPQFALQAETEVMVKAKISLSGNAISQPGDIEAEAKQASVGDGQTVKLHIEHIVQ